MANIEVSLNTTDCLRSIALNDGAGATMIIKGPPGVGKTAITKQYKESQGDEYGLFEFNAATANLADTIGFLLPQARNYGTNDEPVIIQAGQYTYPHYFFERTTKRPAFQYKRGMVVIEEYGQGTPDVKRALAPLFLEKRIGDFQLPDGFMVVALSNRASDRSGVGKDFDFVINRRVEINLKPELDAWVDWAATNNVETLCMAFASRNQDIVFGSDVPKDQGPWLTPRSLVLAGEQIRSAEKMNIALEDPILTANLAGSIGSGNAVMLLAFARLRHELPKLSDILKDPGGTILPATPDGQSVITFELANRITDATVGPIMKYMSRFQKAFSVTFIKTALKRNAKLIQTKEFGEWARNNHQLLAAISR